MQRVIVQFLTFEDRDKWVEENKIAGNRLKNAPTLVIDATVEMLDSLKKIEGVKVYPDVKMSPF